jgi:hypothetical protein
MIVLTYVPCETSYLNHLLTSYNNHYEIDLNMNQDSKNSIKGRSHISDYHGRGLMLEVLPEQS